MQPRPYISAKSVDEFDIYKTQYESVNSNVEVTLSQFLAVLADHCGTRIRMRPRTAAERIDLVRTRRKSVNPLPEGMNDPRTVVSS